MFFLFKQDDRALKYLHEIHLTGDMDFKKFKQFLMVHERKNMDLLLSIHGITHIMKDFGTVIHMFIFH